MNKEIAKKVLTLFGFIMPAIIIGLVFFSMYFLPDKIPVHFDTKWNATRVGGQYEMLILGLVFYFIPIIISMICKNIKFFWAKTICLILSICVSITFYGISINFLVRVFMNSQVVISHNIGHWLSFVMTIIGFCLVIISSITILFDKNLLFKKKEDIMLGNTEYNKINFILSVMIFLFGVTICIGCTILKNYYSFVIFFGAAIVYGLICYLALMFVSKKQALQQYN